MDGDAAQARILVGLAAGAAGLGDGHSAARGDLAVDGGRLDRLREARVDLDGLGLAFRGFG